MKCIWDDHEDRRLIIDEYMFDDLVALRGMEKLTDDNTRADDCTVKVVADLHDTSQQVETQFPWDDEETKEEKLSKLKELYLGLKYYTIIHPMLNSVEFNKGKIVDLEYDARPGCYRVSFGLLPFKTVQDKKDAKSPSKLKSSENPDDTAASAAAKKALADAGYSNEMLGRVNDLLGDLKKKFFD